MKILGINSSPRKEGNSATLLNKALEGAKSLGAITEKIDLTDLNIAPCQEEEYDHIKEDGTSIVDDDWQKVYEKVRQADAVIVASPIYFGSVSAQLKTLIDRFQCVWLAKNIYNKDVFTKVKKGAFICVEATNREDFFQNARSIIRNFFAILNIEYSQELLCTRLDKKGSVRDHADYLDKSFELGKKLIKL